MRRGALRWQHAALVAALAVLLLVTPVLTGLTAREAPPAAPSVPPEPPTEPAPTEPPLPRGNPRFGVNGVLAADDAAGRTLRAAGVGFERLEVRWDEIEPEPDQIDFRALDQVVERAERLGVGLDVVLIGIPIWARADPDAPGGRVPANLDAPVFRPDGTINRKNYWAAFVFQLARRYAGRVDAWEVWNEPNLIEFWSGSPAEYHRLLVCARQAIRAADPHARVLFGGIYYTSGDQIPFLEQVLADERPDEPSFDVLGLHIYHRVAEIERGIRAAKRILGRFGLDRPIWLNETNTPANYDYRSPTANPRGLASLDEQASFVIQAHAIALAAGAEHVSWYRAHEVGEWLTWGLLRADLSPRPALDAYRVVTRYFADAAPLWTVAAPDHTLVALRRPGERVTVAWATGARAVLATIPDVAPDARLLDRYGNERPLALLGRTARVPLPPATLRDPEDPQRFMVGGEPFLLVERSP